MSNFLSFVPTYITISSKLDLAEFLILMQCVDNGGGGRGGGVSAVETNIKNQLVT
jgi:hypothetical protein